jgi:hypothetical protein
MKQHDVSKESTKITLPQAGDPLGKPPQVEPPHAVTKPPSPNQPNQPLPIPPTSKTAATLPDKVSASQIKTQSQQWPDGRQTRGAMSFDAIKAQSRRYGNTW